MIGYSFNNYTVPENEWGKLLTADDMRYTYMFGIDAIAQDLNETIWQDSQFDFYVDDAVGEFERFLTIDIRKRRYVTPGIDEELPDPRVRSQNDAIIEYEDTYPFIPAHWGRRGFLQLRHYPVLSIQRCVLNNSVGRELFDLKANKWIRLTRKTGQLHFFPSRAAYLASPSGAFGLPQVLLSSGFRYAAGYEVDYTTGYSTSDFVPHDLRSVIGKFAAIKALASIGDGLLAGFSSQSVSLDGMSESFSSTQSATSAYFGARIKQYQEEVKDWLHRNRYKHGNIPFGFSI